MLALSTALSASCGNDANPGGAGASGAEPAASGASGASTSAGSGGVNGSQSGAAGGTAVTGGANTNNGGTNTGSGGASAPGGTSAGGSNVNAGSAGLTSNGGSSSTSGGASTTSSGGMNAGGVGGTTSASGGKGGGAAGTAGKAATGGAGGGASVTFATKSLSADHYAEGADVGDIDGDGKLDLVAGPIWYKGPDFALGGKLLDPVPTFTRDQYSKFFITFVDDLDGDAHPDVIGVGDPGGGNGSGTPNAYWYKNPGPQNLSSAWTTYPLFSALVSNESPAYANLLGDARKELVFMTNRQLGYATPSASPTEPWTFHAISGSTFNTPYVHGLGVGDINGDGLPDVVERSGWWQQPSTGTTWQQHTVDFGVGLTGTRASSWGGAQMAVFDVDGDGDSDVVSALAAHQYGLSWFEQVDADNFTAHEILPPTASATSFSQQHALSVGDFNGDGLPDIVTGKRYYAHPSTNADPGTTDPPVLYWFELSRGATVSFTPHLIHNDSGAGCNFPIRDVTGDGKLDIFVTNKHGSFLHTQL